MTKFFDKAQSMVGGVAEGVFGVNPLDLKKEGLEAAGLSHNDYNKKTGIIGDFDETDTTLKDTGLGQQAGVAMAGLMASRGGGGDTSATATASSPAGETARPKSKKNNLYKGKGKGKSKTSRLSL